MKCSQALPSALISALLFLSPAFGQIELLDPEFAEEAFASHPPVFVDPVELAVVEMSEDVGKGVQSDDSAAWVGRWNETASGNGYYEEEPYYAYNYSDEYESGVAQPIPDLEIGAVVEEDAGDEIVQVVDFEYSYKTYLDVYDVDLFADADTAHVSTTAVLKSVAIAVVKSAVADEVAPASEAISQVEDYSLDYAYEEDAYYYGDYEYEYADLYEVDTRYIEQPSPSDFQPADADAVPTVEEGLNEIEIEVLGDDCAYDNDYQWMDASTVVEDEPWAMMFVPSALAVAHEVNNVIYAHSPIAWSIRSIQRFENTYRITDSLAMVRQLVRQIGDEQVVADERMNREQAMEDLMMDVSEVSDAEKVEVRDYCVPEMRMENGAEDSVYEFDAAWYPAID